MTWRDPQATAIVAARGVREAVGRALRRKWKEKRVLVFWNEFQSQGACTGMEICRWRRWLAFFETGQISEIVRIGIEE
jgi:hypothetical protein